MKKIIFIILSFIFAINNVSAKSIEQELEDLKETTNQLQSQITELKENRLDLMYPIGSIYETTTYSTAAEVNNALGGTWEVYGSGKTLVGVDANDSNFSTVNKTGGNSSTTLSVSNLPSHTHSIPALSGTAAKGTTAATGGDHTHTRGTMEIQGQFNIRTTNSTANTTVMDTSGSFSKSLISWSGSHSVLSYAGANPAYYQQVIFKASNNWTGATSSDGAHTHTVTTTANASGETGSGTSFTNLQPYITVYMYKRVA